MRTKSASKPKRRLTYAERRARFKELSRKVRALDNPKDFEKAFKTVLRRFKAKTKPS